MEAYYDRAWFYRCELDPCPKCGGAMRMTMAVIPTPVCSECETVYVPDITKAVADWWNNEH